MQNKQSFILSDNQCTNFLPIMLALCSMLLATYYAPNYAGIIGVGQEHRILSYIVAHLKGSNV